MLGAAGISAFPMSARVIQRMGQEADPQNHLLMRAVGANVAGRSPASSPAASFSACADDVVGGGMNSVFQQSLVLMLKGMVGIFTVIILIYFVIVILNAISRRKREKIFVSVKGSLRLSSIGGGHFSSVI